MKNPGDLLWALVQPSSVHKFVMATLTRAAFLALLALAIDLLSTWLESPFAGLRINGATPETQYGARFITFFLAYLSVLPTVVVALTSLAVTTISPYGSPSLLMLMPKYQPRLWERVLFLSTGGFQRALTMSLGLTASLLVLSGSRQLGWTRNELPAASYVGLLTLISLVSVLIYVAWLIDIRRPSQVVLATADFANKVLDHLQRLGKSGKLRPEPWRGVASPYPTLYREQEHLKRCVYALTELSARAMTDRQYFSARESLAALRKVSERYRTNFALPEDWGRLQNNTVDHTWFDQMLVESFEVVALAAIERHQGKAARDSFGELVALGPKLTGCDVKKSERVLDAMKNVLDACVESKEVGTLERLLGDATAVFEVMSGSMVGAPDRHPVRDCLVGSAARAVTTDDVQAVRALRTMLTILVQSRRSRRVALAAIVDLGAIALASRRYQSASLLIDWFLDVDRPMTLLGVATLLPLRAPLQSRPRYAQQTYMQVFVILTAARGLQFERRLGPLTKRAVSRFVAGLPNAKRRAEFTCLRMCKVVSFPDSERDRWFEQIGAVLV